MICDVCNKEYNRGQGFHGSKYKSIHFCSQECYDKFVKIKIAPKPPINYKPAKGTDRRKFTDYIQEWTDDKVNWQWIMKQAKDIQEEYEIDWKIMYHVLKYCREYEDIDWNMEYGLYQFFPKYIKPMQDFSNAIIAFKTMQFTEDETQVIKKKKSYVSSIDWGDSNTV